MFVLTPSELHVVYVCESRVLASVRLAADHPGSHPALLPLPSTTASKAAAPSLPRRPSGGPLALLGVWDGGVWMADARARVHMLPLPRGALCRSLGAHGELLDASQQGGVPLEQHDALARFLQPLGGAAHALWLPGA
eukprot:717439-Pyramimonas_sp.AAC.1